MFHLSLIFVLISNVISQLNFNLGSVVHIPTTSTTSCLFLTLTSSIFCFRRTSVCDRPRTYDKFYQKLPGNYCNGSKHPDRATSVCSSEEETDGTDRTRTKDKRKKKRAKDVSRTITERDVRHLERHLSMKKTIRKKIMRDLQQAFVDDPAKFQTDPPENPINLNSLNFDPKNHNPTDQKFLDLLRDSDDSGNGSQPSANEDGGTPVLSKSGSGCGSQGRTQKLRSVRERSKSAPRIPIVSDSSSCGGYESAESDRFQDEVSKRSIEDLIEVVRLDDDEDVTDSKPGPAPEQPGEKSGPASDQKPVKKSFWKKLTGGGKKKDGK